MGSKNNFCWIEFLSVSGGSEFIRLGDPYFGSLAFKDLIVRNDSIAPNFPNFSAPYLSSLETLPRRCAKLTDSTKRCAS